MDKKEKQSDRTVDDFFHRAVKWKEEMSMLRSILLSEKLEETLKWNQPCYGMGGKNIAIISAFKEHCIIGFFKGALINDASQLLVRPGNHTQSGRQMRFTDVADIQSKKRVISRYIKEAIQLEKAGAKVEYKKTEDYSIPSELASAFKRSASFKKAFERLTPGRQRGYLLFFSGAKQSETRRERIQKCREKIMEGKGLQD
ncbi:MAG: YdeI/OmpD-associated family protein [Flavobacteriales bacterium]